MRTAMCPNCRTVHEATGQSVLDDLSDDDKYRVTHCKLCETPCGEFHRLPDLPDLSSDDIGYPLAVVPWVDGAPGQLPDEVLFTLKPRGPNPTMTEALRKVTGHAAFNVTSIEAEVSLRLARRKKST